MSTITATKSSVARAFFDDLANRQNEPLLHRVAGTIEWNIQGVGRWWVRINHGSVHVSQSPQDADCIGSCDADTFASIINGQENMMAAALRGVLHVSGNTALGLSFQRLLH